MCASVLYHFWGKSAGVSNSHSSPKEEHNTEDSSKPKHSGKALVGAVQGTVQGEDGEAVAFLGQH